MVIFYHIPIATPTSAWVLICAGNDHNELSKSKTTYRPSREDGQRHDVPSMPAGWSYVKSEEQYYYILTPLFSEATQVHISNVYLSIVIVFIKFLMYYYLVILLNDIYHCMKVTIT